MSTDSRRQEFFERLWEDFVRMAPQAAALRQRLIESGERVANDHVAFRTLRAPGLALDDLEPHLLELGYRKLDDYDFAEKHLDARAYVCPGWPRVFLSQLRVEELSAWAAHLLHALADEARQRIPAGCEVFWAGRLWAPLNLQSYRLLAEESEYAAWLGALGLRPNHFTVSVNALTRLRSVADVLAFVEGAGYRINEAGGRIKGSPQELLEQGSTLADRVEVEFEGATRAVIPTCYYEFALRYPDAKGVLYEGFVPASANRIFESTDL